MALKKTPLSVRRAVKKYEDRLKSEGLVSFQRYVKPEHKDKLDTYLKYIIEQDDIHDKYYAGFGKVGE